MKMTSTGAGISMWIKCGTYIKKGEKYFICEQEGYDPCSKVHDEESMCAEVVTALMQDKSFADSVLRIEP